MKKIILYLAFFFYILSFSNAQEKLYIVDTIKLSGSLAGKFNTLFYIDIDRDGRQDFILIMLL